MSKIIHLGRNGIIMNSYVKFIEDEFDINEHLFFLTGKDTNNSKNVIDITNKKEFLKDIYLLNRKLYSSEKIIIHGFSQSYMFYMFFLQPWLLKKVYWVIWGWDLCSYLYPKNTINLKIIENIKRVIIPRIDNFVTYIKGDYELAQKWYGAKGSYHECIMYPSNLFKEINIRSAESDTINIQVGNSADSLNNHLQVLEKLKIYKNENIKVFVPLSYGDKEYSKEVIKKGEEIFGDKFIAITEIMAFDKYIEFLENIDIALFNSDIQIAMGNTIKLLGLGKKVYLKKTTSQWQLFKDIDVKVFNVEGIELNLIDTKTKIENQQKIKEYFSQENYLKQLQNLFEN